MPAYSPPSYVRSDFAASGLVTLRLGAAPFPSEVFFYWKLFDKAVLVQPPPPYRVPLVILMSVSFPGKDTP